VFPDSNKKYMNTDLVKKEPVKEDYLSTDIVFAEYKPVSRLNVANVSIL
jgi:cysteine synthase